MTGLRWNLATGGIAGAFASDLRTAGPRPRGRRIRVGRRVRCPLRHPPRARLVRGPGGRPRRRHRLRVDAAPDAHHENARPTRRHVLAEKAFTLNRAEAGRPAGARGRTRPAGHGGDVDAVPAAHGPHPRAHRRRPRRDPRGERRPHAAAPSGPQHRLNAPSSAAAPCSTRHLSDLLHLGHPRRTDHHPRRRPTRGDRSGLRGRDCDDARGRSGLDQLSVVARAAGPNVASIIGTAARIDIDTVCTSHHLPAWSCRTARCRRATPQRSTVAACSSRRSPPNGPCATASPRATSCRSPRAADHGHPR